VSFAESSAIRVWAAELRAQRKRLGWTQEQLGEKIGFSGSFVSDVERCERAPGLDFAKACDREMGTPGTFERWHELTSREAFPSYFAHQVAPYEREAVRIHGWEIGAVPGLWQTESYARALISSGRPMDTPDAIDRLVADRMKRQAILNRPRTPFVWYVVDERVLRHTVGGRPVMAGQLDRLLTVPETPGMVVQVLPFAADNHAGSDGPITVYEFTGKPTVAYTEAYSGGQIVEAGDEVAHLVTVMSLLRAAALPVSASVELIRTIRSDLDG
jgi:transcriptional regulator with XRE-family HTH domain